MENSFSVYGDSIAFGYGNNNKSWFDILNDSQNKYKYAKNGELIENVLEKISIDTNTYDVMIIAVGINNLLQESRKKEDFVDIKLMSQYDKIIENAVSKSKKVFVQSVLPVIEKRFPKQDWLDIPKYAYNTTIDIFNKMIKFLATKHSVTYVDANEVFKTKDLQELYIDAVHLNAKGQEELKNIYTKIIE